MSKLQKTAADLGEKNIPRNIIDMLAPEPVMVLFWREEASNPANTTVELWKTTGNSYAVFSGLYTGTWQPENVENMQDTKGPLFDSLEEGLAAVKRGYTFGELEEPHEQTASSKVKRLIRKNNI